jgi:hypothetical protein
MDNHHNMLYLEYLDSILKYRKAVQIRMDDKIGDIAMDKNFAWQQPRNLVCSNPAIRAADIVQQFFDEVRQVLPRHSIKHAGGDRLMAQVLSSIPPHGKRVRVFSAIELVNALELEKARGKQR